MARALRPKPTPGRKRQRGAVEPLVAQLDELRNTDLLRLWAEVMTALRERDVIRSGNSPVGYYCERLVAYHYRADLETNSRAGYDLIADGKKIQVKGRRWTTHSKPSHYSVIRGLDAKKFDVFVAVHLNEDYTVDSAWRLPWKAVRRLSKRVDYLNGARLPIIRGTERDIERMKLRVLPGD